MIPLYKRLKDFWWRTMERIHPSLHNFVFRFRIYLKYLVSGGTAAGSNLISLALLVEVFRFHYLTASIISFLIGFSVSFVLQKFFTFGNSTLEKARRQLTLYLLIAVTNLGINTLLVYLLVDFAHVWYFAAQFISGIFIAVEGFILYRRFVFVRRISQSSPEDMPKVN